MKRSREEIAEIDVELIPRANRFGRSYQTIVIEDEQEPEEIRKEGDIEQRRPKLKISWSCGAIIYQSWTWRK